MGRLRSVDFGGLGLAVILWNVGFVPAAWAETYQFTSDFGNVGLLQAPSARFADEGELRAGYTRALPYDYIFISATPYEWMEATYRYSEFNNELRVVLGDTVSYLDKSFDVKFRLAEEDGLVPAMALGIQDVGGTGFLASEYFVASRRFGSFDFSLGLGWGRLGARGGLSNPLGWVADRFEEPRAREDRGGVGEVSLSGLFKGEEIGFFGGVRWQPEGAPYAVVVEREGNDYQSEPFGNNLDVDFPVNVGLNYHFSALDLGLAYERGDQLTFHVAVAANFERDHGPAKVFDPPPTPVGAPRFAAAPDSPDAATAVEQDAAFVEALREALARQRFTVVAVDFQREMGSATIWFRQGMFRNPAKAAGRVARAASSLAPPAYQRFTLVAANDSLEEYRVTVERMAIRAAANQESALAELTQDVYLSRPRAERSGVDVDGLAPYPAFDWRMGPKVRQNVGDPNGFYYGQLWWSVAADLQLTDRLSLSGGVGFDIVNNFDELERESDSELPHVRSDIKDYLQQGENNLVRLEANYLWPIAKDWYGRFSAGIFEEMYGGLAGEVLYRPFGKPWALGANLNRVRKRDFDQRFDFLDYEVTTGHVTLYYEFRPLRMRAIASVGRYLAGDYGATLDLSREFSSGARFGVFATKTDVSAEEFGEGSFDKGFYITMPLDLFFPRSVKRSATFFFRPLTRDGGQKVDDGRSLYYETGDNSLYDFADGWPEVMR